MSTSTAPACTGVFDTTCVDCGRLTHRRNSRIRRSCEKGHQTYGGRGRCNTCYCRAYRGHRLPRISLRRHGNRKPRQPSTRVLVNLRKAPRRPTGTILAPCSGCWRIRPLPYGPGDAYCEDCDPTEPTTEEPE